MIRSLCVLMIPILMASLCVSASGNNRGQYALCERCVKLVDRILDNTPEIQLLNETLCDDQSQSKDVQSGAECRENLNATLDFLRFLAGLGFASEEVCAIEAYCDEIALDQKRLQQLLRVRLVKTSSQLRSNRRQGKQVLKRVLESGRVGEGIS